MPSAPFTAAGDGSATSAGTETPNELFVSPPPDESLDESPDDEAELDDEEDDEDDDEFDDDGPVEDDDVENE